jgi:hypothetical protein
MRKQATVVAADEWLNGLIHQSPAFQAQVEGALAAISVAQDVVALRESRGLSQAQFLGGHPKPAIDGHLKTGHHA